MDTKAVVQAIKAAATVLGAVVTLATTAAELISEVVQAMDSNA